MCSRQQLLVFCDDIESDTRGVNRCVAVPIGYFASVMLACG